MLIKAADIINSVRVETPQKEEKTKGEAASVVVPSDDGVFVDDKSQSLTKAIGNILPGTTTHYFSYGNFNLVRLILHLLRQTGPAHVFMTSYSISAESIQQIQRRIELEQILSFRLIIDNRVKSLSPKPFQMLSTIFNYRCSSVHAKIALIWNDHWNISIVTSQNATNNPKMERGIIFTDPRVFDFDLNALENEFDRGTT